MPGRTSCRRDCSALYNGKYCIKSGRGPIIAISPFSTFINCGNSSILVFLTNRPNLVIRCTSGNSLPSGPFFSFIVLNLIILNGLPLYPGRSCKKNAPAPSLKISSRMVTINRNGQIINSTQSTTKKSIMRFKKCLYINSF